MTHYMNTEPIVLKRDHSAGGAIVTLASVVKNGKTYYQVGYNLRPVVKRRLFHVSPHLSWDDAEAVFTQALSDHFTNDEAKAVGLADAQQAVQEVLPEPVQEPKAEPVYYQAEARTWSKAEAKRYPGAVSACVQERLAEARKRKYYYQRHDPCMPYYAQEAVSLWVFAPDGSLLMLETSGEYNFMATSVAPSGSTMLPAGTWVVELHRSYGPFWVQLVEVK